jgi:single-strand DNA-binding protein
MSSVNKAILIGRLGKDVELKSLPSGKPVANFSIATSESWKDKKTGEKQEKTEWHNIVVFDKLAEICGSYLKKGSLVYLEGKIQTRKYTDKNGVEKYMTEILANEMKMLGGKSEGKSEEGGHYEAPKANGGGGDPDEDIPFAAMAIDFQH